MKRDEFKGKVNNLSCHLCYPVLNDLHDIDDHDAEQRQVIEQQAQQIVTLREALEWDGLKVSDENVQWALTELGPVGTRAESYVKAVVEFAIHMRRKAQQAIKEVKP